MATLLEEVTQPAVHRGLEDVVVDESEISRIDGDAGELIYRGYDIENLARGARFEEVLYLLWHGAIPEEDDLADFERDLSEQRSIPPGVTETLRELAAQDEGPMAALRTGVSLLSAYDPDSDADPEEGESTLRKGCRITAKIPTVLATFDRLRNEHDPLEPRSDLGHAANFLYMLTGSEPDSVAAETFDMALTLHADHGLNASTFTTMVIASTYADIYNAITGGIAALSGPWHGGANQDVMYTLLAIEEECTDPVQWVESVIDEGKRVPGWGHRVYNVKDPRAKLLEERSEMLAATTGVDTWHNYTTSIEEYLTDEVGLLEQNIAPNVDFYSGSVYYQLGIPIDLYTPIFAMSRVGGWIAHVLEYTEENRLIRPRARYVGPENCELGSRTDR